MKPNEILSIATQPSTPTMVFGELRHCEWNRKHRNGDVCIQDSGWYVVVHPSQRAYEPDLRVLSRWLVGESAPTTFNVPTGESEAKAVIAQLERMHPEIKWSIYPLGDYDQYAESDAPDCLVAFGNEDQGLETGLVDPYSDVMEELCSPSDWGMSEEAAQLIQGHNKVFITKYPNCDGPRFCSLGI